jgi:hypothetical protein
MQMQEIRVVEERVIAGLNHESTAAVKYEVGHYL